MRRIINTAILLSGNDVSGFRAIVGQRYQLETHEGMRRACATLCCAHDGAPEQIQLLLGHASIQTTERYLGTKQDLTNAPNDHMGLKWRDE